MDIRKRIQQDYSIILNIRISKLWGIILFTSIFGCSTIQEAERSEKVELIARDFFNTFAERKDWAKLCSFYSEDLQFEDIILQLELDSLWQFKRFYNWNDGGAFRKLSPEQKHLTLNSLLVNDNMAVGTGNFNPFYYHDELIDTDWGMDFTIWLYFNQDFKISRQLDWIEYDDLVLENMINRCRTYGHERTPDWLDLSLPE